MKIQYPGVAESINSDVNNLKRLIRFVNVLPKGMYIDETMRAAKEELALECDYSNEALAQKKFKYLLQADSAFYVPAVIDHLSTKRILTTERIYGCALDRLEPTPTDVDPTAAKPHGAHDKVRVSEQVRNTICKNMLRLCLDELFTYRFMQTDPVSSRERARGLRECSTCGHWPIDSLRVADSFSGVLVFCSRPFALACFSCQNWSNFLYDVSVRSPFSNTGMVEAPHDFCIRLLIPAIVGFLRVPCSARLPPSLLERSHQPDRLRRLSSLPQGVRRRVPASGVRVFVSRSRRRAREQHQVGLPHGRRVGRVPRSHGRRRLHRRRAVRSGERVRLRPGKPRQAGQRIRARAPQGPTHRAAEGRIHVSSHTSGRAHTRRTAPPASTHSGRPADSC